MSQDHTALLIDTTTIEGVGEVQETVPRPDLSVFSLMYGGVDDGQDLGPFQSRAGVATNEGRESQVLVGWDGGVATLTEPRTVITVPSVALSHVDTNQEQSGHYAPAFPRQPLPRSPHPAQIHHHSPTLEHDESTPLAFQQVPNPPITPPPNLSALRVRKRPSNKKLQAANSADPQPALPDPSLFPDPYPYSRMGGSEGSSQSARSSAYTSSNYTSPGSSALRSSGTSITDFGHSEKSAPMQHHTADFPPDVPPSPISPVGVGLTVDEAVQVHGPHSTIPEQPIIGESNSRWSSSYDGKPPSRSRSGSWSQFAPPEVASSTKSQFDWDATDTVDERAEYELTTDEEEESFGDDDYHDEHEQSEPPSAILVAEEGRGLIVQGAGLPVSRLTVNPGTTHLVLTSSETPQQIPSFLLAVLPSITTTLLALDISCNFLNALPTPLAHCMVLEELNVASNPLRTLPTWLANLVCLRVLIADSTGVTTLPASMASLNLLHTLSLRRNRLLSLPAWFCHLPSLESLLLDGNNFQGPWKALVDPLLPRAYPQSPMYPPNTPHTAVSMASESDYSDPASAHSLEFPSEGQEVDAVLQDYAATHAAPPLPPPPIPVSSSRSTSPYPVARAATSRGGTPTPRVANALSRTKTAPARHKQGGKALVQALGALDPMGSPVTPKGRHSVDSGDEDDESGDEDRTIGKALASPMVPMQAGARESLYSASGSDGSVKSPRRMRSADELRRMGPMNNNTAVNHNQAPRGLAPRPSREPMPPASHTDPRFLSLRPNPDSRSQVSSALFTPPPKRSATAFTEAPRPKSSASHFAQPSSKSPSPQPPMPVMRPMPGGRDMSPYMDKEGKEKGKWGFLKKMSMNRMRSTSNVPTTAHLRPMIQPAHSAPSIHTNSVSPGLSTVSSSAAASASSSSLSVNMDAPSSTAHGLHPPSHNNSNFLSVNNNAFSGGLLSPNSAGRSTKRRSFLPLNNQPALNIPIPSNNSGAIALGDGDDEDVRQSHFSDSPDAEDSLFVQQQRDSQVRALRSVMAYLRDLSDLGGSSGTAPFANQSQQGFLSSNNFASTPDLTASSSSSSVRSGLRRTGTTPDSSFTLSTAAPSQRSLRSTPSTASLRGPAASFATNDSRDSSRSTGGEEKKVKDDKNKRAMIVKEIVSTERTYVKGLQELVDIYIKPAAVPVTALGASSKETTVPAPERKVVFNGLDSLLSFHRESFLPALENAVIPLEHSDDYHGDTSANVAKAVATVFLSHAAFMKMYSTYINNFDNAVQRIKFWNGAPLPPVTVPVTNPSTSNATSAHITAIGRNMAALSSGGATLETTTSAQQPVLSGTQRKRIKAYLKRCRLNPRHSQLNLEGYLLLPVQRIPRYRMLLEELVRTTPIGPDAFYNPLETALAEIASLAINMNEGKRDSESRRKLVQWQSRIRGKFPSPLVQPHRRLIMDGNLNLTRVVRKTSNFFEVVNSEGEKALVSVECLSPEITPKSLVAILCNDLLVLCKDPSGGKDTNGYVDLWAVLRMQTLPQPASIVHGNALRLVDNKAILYFDAQSTSDALTWSRAINMHIPASK